MRRAEGYQAYLKPFEKLAESDKVFIQALSPGDQKLYQERKDALLKEVDESLARYYEDKAQLLSKSEFPGQARKLKISKGAMSGLIPGRVSDFDSSSARRDVLARTFFMLEQMKISPDILSLSLESYPAATSQGYGSIHSLWSMIKRDASKSYVAPKAAKEKTFLNCILKYVKLKQ